MIAINTISVLGLGYIGLPTAAIFAKNKIRVIGVDVNQLVVDTINRGETHIVETDLDDVVRAAINSGYLHARTNVVPASVFLIAVPTPFKDSIEEVPQPDLSYIEAASKMIAPVLQRGNLVILESTSPVGSTEKLASWLARDRPDLTFPHTHGDTSDIRVAYCPERVLPGDILREIVNNDRVIGGITQKCSDAAVQLYKNFVQGQCFITDSKTAEMCKLTENSFRDVNIAFANELSIICDKIGVDVWGLIKLANKHPRVNILRPGPGVGGHCIAVDPWFIVSANPNEARLIQASRQINDCKPHWVLDKVKLLLADYLQFNPKISAEDVNIACYGLTFKADIDDLRESPAMQIVELIANAHPGKVSVVEPNIDFLPEKLNEKVFLVHSNEALRDADIAVFLVNHKSFSKLLTAWEGKFVLNVCGIEID